MIPGDRNQLENWIRAACLLEATARKPGNVHPQASFTDLSYADFVRSADVVAPILAKAKNVGVGLTIFQASQATREEIGKNTNLGIILLLAPLAAVPWDDSLEIGIRSVLANLTQEDAEWTYRAIRFAEPGGMGNAETGDISGNPPGTLLEMMKLAAARDRIASEYASGFAITLKFGLSFLSQFKDFENHWEAAIIELYLSLMAEYPDTLIARKCGREIAEQSACLAKNVLQAGPIESQLAQERLKQLDDWLRADGHQRNPGTTADLVAACLFAAFREGRIPVPSKFSSSPPG